MSSKNYVEIPGSGRPVPQGAATPAGAIAARSVQPAEPIEVSVYLKPADAAGDDPADVDSDPLLELKPVAAGEAIPQTPVTARGAMRDQRLGSLDGAIAKVTDFASAAGLTVVKVVPERRLVKLSGPADKFEAAFRTKLNYYSDGKGTYRGRSGGLSVPEDVASVIESVLGLDTRPQAQPRLTRHPEPHAVGGHLPNEVARFYDFPVTAGRGKGQCIAIIELGGGYRNSDNAKAFKAMGVPLPTIVPIGVTGGANSPGVDVNADGEVALDIQVAGGAAPGATIVVYFAPNTDQGFVDAITRAVHDEVHKPSVISISWGAAERAWTGQALRTLTAALRDAAHLGVTVFAASGDNLATDGQNDGKPHVDFPASSPYVVGCGGTVIDGKNRIASEEVWNTGDAGTGGGVSASFPAPAYQANVKLPKAPGGRRRGVPDVAGDADPHSGYRLVLAGGSAVIGGTSAVAPLWAGLMALINEASGKAAGFIHPVLYGNQGAFRDIVKGNNKAGGVGYVAGPGWDPCTGLGSPNGGALLEVFRKLNAELVADKGPGGAPAAAAKASVPA